MYQTVVLVAPLLFYVIEFSLIPSIVVFTSYLRKIAFKLFKD